MSQVDHEQKYNQAAGLQGIGMVPPQFNGQIAPPHRGEIPQSVETLNAQLDILEKTIEQLGPRLEAVTTPAPPTVSTEKRSERGAGCDLARFIFTAADRIQTMRERVEFLLSRLEL